MSGRSNWIDRVIFSPEGEVLASVYQDGTILLWDVANGQTLGDPLQGHTGQARSIAFSPDGKTLISGSEDGAILVWDVDINSMLNRVCEKAGRNFTQEEWEFYFLGDPYHKTCEQWPEGM